MNLEIISYEPEYSTDFYELNVEWLDTFFYVEDFDREVLSNPEKYILDPGGYIFFALQEGQVLGTVALMPTEEENILELTKMAVNKRFRGHGIGQTLMQYCIDFAKDFNYKALMLYSNTKLANAIHIYRKYGFRELELEQNGPYKRGNIKMQLDLNSL